MSRERDQQADRQGAIVRLFGCDGAGKTTIARMVQPRLSEALGFEVPILSGTHPETWPDQTFHAITVAERINDAEEQDAGYYRRKMLACYRQAGVLAQQGMVLLDSDPLTKTVINEYAEAHRLRTPVLHRDYFIIQRYNRLTDVAHKGGLPPIINVYVSPTASVGRGWYEGASKIQSRLDKRGKSQFDPVDILDTQHRLSAADELARRMDARREPLVHFTNDDLVITAGAIRDLARDITLKYLPPTPDIA